MEHAAAASESVSERAESPARAWSPGLGASIAACVVGGLVGAGVIHAIAPVFPYADLPELGIAPPPELVAKHRDATLAFWSQNFAIDFAILGLCLGAAVGCVADRNRRVAAIVLGAVCGSIGGAIASFVLGRFIALAIIQSADQSLVQSTIFHFIAWSAMLAPALAAIGFLHRGIIAAPSFALGGIGLGVLAAVTYNLAFSVAFSQANLLMLVPVSLTERIVWGAVCAAAVGLGLSLGSRTRQVALDSGR